MSTHIFILFMLLSLQTSYVALGEHTNDQINMFRKFRYVISHESGGSKALCERLWKGLVSSGATARYPPTQHRVYRRMHQADVTTFCRLLIAEVVPKSAPFIIGNLNEPTSDMSRSDLEYCLEALDTIVAVASTFSRYLQRMVKVYVEVDRIVNLRDAYKEQLESKIFECVFGRTDAISGSGQASSDISPFVNMWMAAERDRVSKTFDYNAVSSFTQASLFSVPVVVRRCREGSLFLSRAINFDELVIPTMEELTYALNYHSLVAQKLAILVDSLWRFLDQKGKTAPAGSWVQHEIENALRTQLYPLEKVRNEYVSMANKYRKNLARLWKTLLPKDPGTHLEILKDINAWGALSEVQGRFPELDIFLQLPPDDVPREYLQMAAAYHRLTVHLCYNAAPGITSEGEFSIRSELYSAYEQAAFAYNYDQDHDSNKQASVGFTSITALIGAGFEPDAAAHYTGNRIASNYPGPRAITESSLTKGSSSSHMGS
ncbi:hypothetical protein SeLEV6574_g01590 [Synchytrium endobioticum]|uniref:Uncharacterized protein n=1 Tax=Synchytrium endobioticum TaxID=286115 RepID=A0A507DD70_9FUNG|nr:hypothetical protein SeLEV6574_g01590 [Synchytrium endobioticum]